MEPPELETRGAIRVGPAGWSYEDWRGVVYPDAGSRFDSLAFLARYFDAIEVNTSFYRTPPAGHATSWLRRTSFNQNFRFTIKLFQGFTHQESLPGDSDVRAFHDFLAPIAGAGRLGALLMQFPWSFRATGRARERLSTLFDLFSGYPIVVEVRHGSFQIERFHHFLEEHRVGFVNIDQPVIGDAIPPTSIVTGDPAYVRFHGRNYEKWIEHDEPWQRYDYLYAQEELDPWVGRIRSMARSNDVFAITNNHFRGQAIVNAIDLKRSLDQPVEVPPPLAAYYGPRVLGDPSSFRDSG